MKVFAAHYNTGYDDQLVLAWSRGDAEKALDDMQAVAHARNHGFFRGGVTEHELPDPPEPRFERMSVVCDDTVVGFLRDVRLSLVGPQGIRLPTLHAGQVRMISTTFGKWSDNG